MRWQKNRDGFSMITAIFVIVLMATVAMFIMSISGKMVKETAAQYQREQSMLLANSYMEYTVMSVMSNEHNTSNCLDNITGKYEGYNIDVNISYIGNDANLGGASSSSCSRILSSSVITPKSPLNIIVDVFVGYVDYDDINTNPQQITYHKRKLIKI